MLQRMSTDNRLACALTTNSLASASVDRVDLFINLRFEDNHEAAKVLKQLGLQFAAQQKSVSVYATSAYWNPGKGKSYQVICYAKGLQLQAKRQRMRTKNEFLDKIVDEANGIVRIELRLRKPELEKLGATSLTAWDANTPRRLFQKYFERLPIFNVTWGPLESTSWELFARGEALVSSPSGRHQPVEFLSLPESETPLKKSRFTESQIVAVLKEGEAGMPVAELCRKHGISNATYYLWKSKYSGVQVSELQRLRELEAENAKLKRMFADLALENAAIKDVLNRKS